MSPIRVVIGIILYLLFDAHGDSAPQKLRVSRRYDARDGYGAGISKSTTSGSDPIAFFAFLQRYFPVHCQDASTPCNSTFDCGSAGRAVLCLDAGCTYPRGVGAFGLHFANMSARPSGSMDNTHVEKLFTEKLSTGFHRKVYDSFMDFATVLYSVSLDSYIEKFEADAVPFLLLRWKDDLSQPWYSLLVQVSTSQLVLELVSDAEPKETLQKHAVIEDDMQRLPASVFSANSVASASPSILVPLAVSKSTSNMHDVHMFYSRDLLASLVHSQTSKDGTVTLATFSLLGAKALVRIVQRPLSSTKGDFTVADLENVKSSAHTMSYTDAFCGVDKWYDNHFAYDQNSTYLDTFKANFDQSGRAYHIFGDCKPQKIGPGTNMYVVDPTGDTVQVNGHWRHCPQGGSGDALQDACSQGACSKYVASATCSESLLSLCAALQGKNSRCSDCAYRQWEGLAAAGCRNADIVNYCSAPKRLWQQHDAPAVSSVSV